MAPLVALPALPPLGAPGVARQPVLLRAASPPHAALGVVLPEVRLAVLRRVLGAQLAARPAVLAGVLAAVLAGVAGAAGVARVATRRRRR